jgi:hypothetical protein
MMFPVLICALSLTLAKADPERQIRVELELGQSYALALGQVATANAKQLVEAELAKVLSEKIRYFSFVPSTQPALHTLRFRIDRPDAGHARAGGVVSLYDYYVFLDLKKNDSTVQKTEPWLFRDAASNLNGVDTPETIAEKLSSDIRNEQLNVIISEMLSKVSFTEKAHFIKYQGTSWGWIIDYSRQALCMQPNSDVHIESIVPSEGFEERFTTKVKKQLAGDEISTFTKATGDVDALIAEPQNARVVAVYVINYEAEADCEATLVESSPSMVSFGTGGAQ